MASIVRASPRSFKRAVHVWSQHSCHRNLPPASGPFGLWIVAGVWLDDVIVFHGLLPGYEVVRARRVEKCAQQGFRAIRAGYRQFHKTVVVRELAQGWSLALVSPEMQSRRLLGKRRSGVGRNLPQESTGSGWLQVLPFRSLSYRHRSKTHLVT